MKNAFASIVVAALALSSTAFAAGNYKVDVKTPTDAKKGAPAYVMIHIEGTNGFGMNIDYPVQLTITPPAGVTVEKTTQTKADAQKFTKAGLDFIVKITSADAGQKDFTGTLKFAVTDNKNMAPVAEKISFTVTVK
ncbi:hypothetical protein [Stigmatella hybrida]|uniref:hypothetical protein n=1 Tax=Stigmatella hybrida TaxID=394097 RepID=UPI001CDABA11|nr:hypothetical protein [Stigmatella hybrida]